jgi:hypothetical protein
MNNFIKKITVPSTTRYNLSKYDQSWSNYKNPFFIEQNYDIELFINNTNSYNVNIWLQLKVVPLLITNH